MQLCAVFLILALGAVASRSAAWQFGLQLKVWAIAEHGVMPDEWGAAHRIGVLASTGRRHAAFGGACGRASVTDGAARRRPEWSRRRPVARGCGAAGVRRPRAAAQPSRQPCLPGYERDRLPACSANRIGAGWSSSTGCTAAPAVGGTTFGVCCRGRPRAFRSMPQHISYIGTAEPLTEGRIRSCGIVQWCDPRPSRLCREMVR